MSNSKLYSELLTSCLANVIIVDSVNLAHVTFFEDRAQCNCCFQIGSRQGGGGNL